MGEKKPIAVFALFKRNKQGFTLLEMIMAVSILSIGLLALASLQLTTIRGKAAASGHIEGGVLAATRMGKLLVLPYTDAALSAGVHADPHSPDGYAIIWRVSENYPVKNTKTIDLTVTWAEHGIKKRVAMKRVVVHLL